MLNKSTFTTPNFKFFLLLPYFYKTIGSNDKLITTCAVVYSTSM